jgi:hypothetical protein
MRRFIIILIAKCYEVDKTRRVSWAGRVTHMCEMRNTYKVFVGKGEEKRSLRKLMRRWEDDIKNNLKEIWCESVDWIHAAQDQYQWRAVVNTVMISSGPMIGSEYFDWLSVFHLL